MDLALLQLNVHENIAEVILNRPSKYNTMPPSFFEEIRRAFNFIDSDPHIRVAIIWAEGRMFTAGLDLKEAASLFTESGESRVAQAASLLDNIKDWQDAFSCIHKCKKPVIAAVHGDCIGGGIDLITACDIRLCTTDAKFCVKETKVAIVADLGTLQRLPKIIGRGPAREMCLTGDVVDAPRAKSFNLVNEIYASKESMLDSARKMAQSIAANSPLVVQGTKLVLNFADEHSVQDGLDYVALFNSAFLRSEDLQEAFLSFMQKRRPVFHNKL